MSTPGLSIDATALLVIDPYNDFISRLGKGRPLLRTVATDVDLVDHIRALLEAARSARLHVVYAPHRRHRAGTGVERFPTPTQFLARQGRFFSARGRGGRFHRHLAPAAGDFVATEHATSSGFGGTDLHEHLQSRGVSHLVVCGLLTNSCIESTVRQAVDLGYHVTVVADAVASWSRADHDAGLRGSLPWLVHELATTSTVTDALAAGRRA